MNMWNLFSFFISKKETKMKNKFALLLSLSFVLIIALTACQPETSQPAEAVQTTEAPAVAACPIGTWNMSDFISYILSMQQNLSSMTNSEYTFKDTVVSGNAQFVFNEDQTAVFRGDNFTESFTMSVNPSGTAMDIPITIQINGSSTSKYSIDADKISFSDQDSGDLVINVDIMGSVIPMDQGLLGQPGTVQLYQFACNGTDTLTLKVIAINDMDLEPLTLTRAQ
jgi:hypothetical protein